MGVGNVTGPHPAVRTPWVDKFGAAAAALPGALLLALAGAGAHVTLRTRDGGAAGGTLAPNPLLGAGDSTV